MNYRVLLVVVDKMDRISLLTITQISLLDRLFYDKAFSLLYLSNLII